MSDIPEKEIILGADGFPIESTYVAAIQPQPSASRLASAKLSLGLHIKSQFSRHFKIPTPPWQSSANQSTCSLVVSYPYVLVPRSELCTGWACRIESVSFFWLGYNSDCSTWPEMAL